MRKVSRADFSAGFVRFSSGAVLERGIADVSDNLDIGIFLTLGRLPLHFLKNQLVFKSLRAKVSPYVESEFLNVCFFFGYPKGTVRTTFLYFLTYRYFNKQCHEDEILQAMKISSYTHKASSKNLHIVSFTTLSVRMETFFNLLHAHVKLQKTLYKLIQLTPIHHSVLPIS